MSRNLVPGRYRGVSVATVDCALDLPSLRAALIGREAYRRTRFLVLRRGDDTALVRVHRQESVPRQEAHESQAEPPERPREQPLFSPIVDLELLAGPEDCAFVHDPETDSGIPSALAAAAAAHAPGSRAVVVQGRYEHVNFIVDPVPLQITVTEVVPPEPAKLADQARRVLAIAEELPPIELATHVVDLGALAAANPAEHYLLPCRGSGADLSGARVSYLDERPPRSAWTLLGCERSRQIHRWCYGDDPPGTDLCPKRRPVPGTVGARLTKCCLQEEHQEWGPGWVSVPWGSSLEQVREALGRLAADREPAWSPG